MAKDRTDDSRFTSRYGGGYVTDAQYLTECLCFLIARQEKKQLYERFWMHPPWDHIFRNQIPAANALLTEFPANVILAMLRDRRCWKLKSLRARSIFNHVLREKMAEHLVKENAPKVIMEKTETVQQPRQRIGGKKSLIALLKESENGKAPYS